MPPSRFSTLAGGSLGRRVTPWIAYYKIARQVADRARGGWSALTPRERSDLARILKESRGRPTAVSAVDRDRIRRIVVKAGQGVARPQS